MSKWLGRSRPGAFPARYFEQAIWSLLTSAADEKPPVADLSYRNDFGRAAGQACLRADPVHLRADTNGLVLFDAAAFDLSLDESQALLATVAEHLEQDGLLFKSGVAHRWFVLAAAAQRLRTTPLPLSRSAPVSVSTLEGDDAAAWRNRINETEMLLNAHPVNQARVARGELPVNSIWLWGEGGMDKGDATRFNGVISKDPCVLGYAQEHALASYAIEHANDIATVTAPGSRLLLTLEECRTHAAYEDFARFTSALEVLEAEWFEPLLKLLSQGKIDELELLPLNGNRYRLGRGSLWAFWKPGRDYRRQAGFQDEQALRV